MSKSQKIYLEDMLERIQRIEQIRQYGEQAFRESFMYQDTLIRNFEVLGEIIKRLDMSIKDEQPHVNWRGFAGFRDVLIHQYDKLILDVIWETSGDELHELKLAVITLLHNYTE